MKKKLGILALGWLGLAGTATWASTSGLGVPKPEKEPVSIREGSVRPGAASGYYATRYFLGGGSRGGK